MRPPRSREPEMEPLLKERFGAPRSVFVPGHRILMNVVPMFLNVLAPWGVFMLTCGVSTFWLMYAHASFAWALLINVYALWLLSVAFARWARRNDPDPTWFSYAAIMIGIMAVAGTVGGLTNFARYSKPFYEIHDLKAIRDLDASLTPSQNVIDGGIFKFVPGTHLEHRRSWHFKNGDLYCVAPIVTNDTVSSPLGPLVYGFWAIGKNCCSASASDFRCGSWDVEGTAGGIRNTESGHFGDLESYRLAVKQAESLYGIAAANPVFLAWSSHPVQEVNGWYHKAYWNYIMMVCGALVVCCVGMAAATLGFSFIGRARSVYDMDILDDKDWKQGAAAALVKKTPVQYATRTYSYDA